MDEDQKSKHSCKFCNKIFPCGRSLGGHMRSHFVTISSPVKKQQKPILVDDEFMCKECGTAFQSWKALFRHMKCHDHRIIITDTDYEAATLCRKKRSDSAKGCTNSLDQQEQEEEVAWSLILLSMDCMSSVDGSYSTSFESSEAQKRVRHQFKKVDTEVAAPIPRKRLKSNEDFECEVNSPKKNGSMNHPFGSDHKKRRNSSKNKCDDSNNAEVNESKFCCIICKKGFPSYQALGGHRASHKKFRGCCAPQTDHLALGFQEKIDSGVECKKTKEHECPICFKIFPTGQALGGHKRSHLTGDQARRRIPEIRDYLDLNLPAPVEEDCNEFKTWWIGTSHHEPLLGLLSS